MNINEDEGGKAQPSGVKKKPKLLQIIILQGCHKDVEKWSCKRTKCQVTEIPLLSCLGSDFAVWRLTADTAQLTPLLKNKNVPPRDHTHKRGHTAAQSKQQGASIQTSTMHKYCTCSTLPCNNRIHFKTCSSARRHMHTWKLTPSGAVSQRGKLH